MNTSPYDNLPVGVREPKQENQQQQENLQYVDVPLHQLASGASGKTAQPQGTAEEGAAGEITLPEVSPQQKEDAATGEMAMTSDTRSETAPPESFEGSQEDEINETDETDTPSETEAVESSDSTESDVKNPPEYSSSIADEHSNALPIKSNGKDVPEDDIVTNDAAGNRALEVAPEKSKALESVSEKNGTAGALPKDHPSRESGRDSGASDAFSRSSWYSKSFLKNITGAGEHLFPFEETLLVPDTMPDMDKVLFAEGSVLLSQPGKTSYRRSDGISGQIIVYTVYKPGDNSSSPVDVIRSAVPFKADDCWDDPESDTFRISLSIKSISAEMLNERKFIVKGTVSIRYTGISQKELMVFDGTGDADLICRTGTIKAANLIFEADETTEISQEVNIREGQPAPVKVLKERFDIVENHRQITSGKLVINGTIISEVLYLGQDEDGSSTLASLRNKTDFTQFIIADEDVDADLLQISFINDGLKATIENQNRFLLQGKVTSVICGYENMDVPIVSDAYHKKHDIAFDISGTSVSCLEGTVCGEVSSREIVNIEEETGKPDTLLAAPGRITEIRGQRNGAGLP